MQSGTVTETVHKRRCVQARDRSSHASAKNKKKGLTGGEASTHSRDMQALTAKAKASKRIIQTKQHNRGNAGA